MLLQYSQIIWAGFTTRAFAVHSKYEKILMEIDISYNPITLANELILHMWTQQEYLWYLKGMNQTKYIFQNDFNSIF